MDRTAAHFRSAKADFSWVSYELVVNDTSEQRGEMCISKSSSETKLAANITSPPGQKKYVLVAGDDIKVYQPMINQVTEYATGKNRDAFESFLVLGFGGSGHELQKQFKVAFGGTEKVDGVNTVKLVLTPNSPRVANLFARIELWIDPNRGVSLQQKLIDPSENYRLAKYSNIEINKPLPEGMFKLKTDRKTVYVYPK